MKDQLLCQVCEFSVEIFVDSTISPLEYFSGSSEYKIAVEDKARLPIYKCKSCGHGFIPISFDSDVINEWYRRASRDNSFLREEAGRRKTARMMLNRIDVLCGGDKGRLLDMGCGPGLFLAEAQKMGWDVEGVEISEWAVRHAREKMNIKNISEGGLTALPTITENSFDVITCFDLIEHLVEPHKLLEELARILKPGGLLVITTPWFGSWLSRVMGGRWFSIMPEHLHYFSCDSLQQLLGKSGFEVEKKRSHTRYFTVEYGWNRLTDYLGLKMWSFPVELIVPINLGDELEVYAHKT
jgi:ubiquinone/menaquinone biosynthesis C-methylase UbiE